ncbi:hypothetical protein [Riemerella anatipestifer]|uniref:hypothetical protein n=1 Tax=Riemerella anatipestifer TaxID=34085 RepID=UPI001BD9C813|nr:hypothetical protein [Riemerella anatipestifer]MBT0554294.1 hypothetical protein [Riemerella anatipestifer]MCE3024969.1 hypothetical protein [Riemerella anatipestifer]MDY3449843.1 hypothetical protein [Riemerella anatipestifer]QYR03339.1 hypothetical protein J6M00_02655 [Riemerella anatipestifer]QYR05608.1 hypothetical protein J6M09_02895 [Riemerella anatipestifer]
MENQEKKQTELQSVSGQEVTFFIPNTESLGKLKDMKPEFSLNLKYKTADDWAALKDQPLRAFFMGTKDIPNEDGELVSCGVFVTQNECFISGQMTLVEAVKNLPTKTPIEITYRGKKNNKSSNGSTMIFDVSKLA